MKTGYNNPEFVEFLNDLNSNKLKRHPKCRGYTFDMGAGIEYTCGYDTNLICDDCKYGGGGKDPKAKCNQDK